MNRAELPERLRREVLGDLRPVRPLPRPAIRALEVAPWAAALFVLVPTIWPLRADASDLGWLLSWGAAATEAVGGLILVALALREAIPGSGLGPARAMTALAGAGTLQLAVALATRAHPSQHGEPASHGGVACLVAQSLLALPILATSVWLIVRALPVRPQWAGALAGAGAGLVADGVWHLICPWSDLAHVLVWHGSGTIAMAAAGWLLGTILHERQRARSGR